jgi:thiamine-phosphate pyrophosphorylase
LNVNSCCAWQLYVIIDAQAAGGRDLSTIAQQAIRGGADVIQLRAKHYSPNALVPLARALHTVTQQSAIPLIINDYPEVAATIGAEGVHVGQADLSIAEVRAHIPYRCLVGKSTHSLEQAMAAQAEGADYIGVGPVYATPTKPDYGNVGVGLVYRVSQHIKIPFVCIGGIDATRVTEVAAAGAQCIAVVRAVCAAPDPQAAAHTLKALLRNSPRTAQKGCL